MSRAVSTMPGIPDVLSATEIEATSQYLAGLQVASGQIPWWTGGHCDPWNHVEAAMALDLGGRFAEAERAYEWLTSMQRPDGAWHAYYLDGAVKERWLDTNVTCYVATGVWHHYLCTRDDAFVRRMWPTVQRSLDWVLSMRRHDGTVLWARNEHDMPWDYALLTGSSSIAHALRSGARIAKAMDEHTMLVWAMNGEPLPNIHGGPLRLIVPGWYGIAWVKWLSRIEVHDRRFMSKYMGREYVTIRGEEREGHVMYRETSVSWMNVKSIVARVFKLKDGTVRILGAAWTDLDVMETGEAWLSALMQLRLDSVTAEIACAGWGGARYRAWTDGTSVAVLLVTTWDTPEDARQFADGMDRWIVQGSSPAAVGPVDGSTVEVWFATDGATLDALRAASA